MFGSLLYLCASRPDIVLSVGVCVQGIKLILKTATCRLSIGSSDIWFIPQGLGCGIQRAPISLLLVTLIQIGLVARMTGNQPLGHINFLVGPW